jgi:hypothetical protein
VYKETKVTLRLPKEQTKLNLTSWALFFFTCKFSKMIFFGVCSNQPYLVPSVSSF